MTTEDIINVINSSPLRSFSDFEILSRNMELSISPLSIMSKKKFGYNGTLATAAFRHGKDIVFLKGFIKTPANWHEDTHGYIKAKNNSNIWENLQAILLTKL